MAIYCKEISQYLELVSTGIVLVSEQNHRLINNIVLPLLERDDVFFDVEIYNKSIAYIEKYYYKMFPFQKFLNFFHYLYDTDGELIFNEYFYYIGRGNGKDGLIAPHANFMQTPYFGIKEYDIPIIANSEDQGKDTFNVVYDMLYDRKKFMKKHFDFTKELIKNKDTKSELYFNTSNGKTKDGQKPGCLIFNELHAYQNYDQLKVHISGLGKKKNGRTIYITTDGDVRGGPLDDLLDLSQQKLNGELPELRLFPFICKVDTDDEALDIAAMEKANPSINYLPNLKAEIKDAMIKMKTRPALKQEYFTKRANLPKRNEDTCVATWEQIKVCTKELPLLYAKNCIMGIDYATFRDFVSVGFLFFENGEWVFVQHSFVCRNSPTIELVKFPLEVAEEAGELTFCEGDMIDEDIVAEYIENEIAKYNVLACVVDTFRLSLIKDMLKGLGFTQRDTMNKWGNLILCRSGEITHTMINPVIESAFSKGIINFGSSRIMRWYTNNVKVTKRPKGNVVYDKINPESRKTDGFMAFVHAFSEREMIIESDGLGEVYEIV